MSDHDTEIVRDYLKTMDCSWTTPDDAEYVARVTARMAVIRRENPGNDYPSAIHGMDDIGACVECDALRCLDR